MRGMNPLFMKKKVQHWREGLRWFLKRQESALFPPSPPGGSIATFIKYHVDLVTEVIQAETGTGHKPKLSAGKSAAGSLGDHVAKLKERW